MGANQSYVTSLADVTGGDRKEKCHDDGSLQKRRKKAKPASPHRPSINTVTNNAISLTWLPPRHTLHTIIAYTVEIRHVAHHNKHWLTLTKNCQGTHYEARHLDSGTEYAFRVRAENIFGTWKPSVPSYPITTKLFESSSDLNCYISHSHSNSSSASSSSPISPFAERRTATTTTLTVPKSVSYEGGLLDASDSVLDSSAEGGMVKSPSLPADSSTSPSFGGGLSTSSLNINRNQYGNFKRRHSFNVHLDGRVSSMLNNSDRFYSTNSLNSSTSTIVMNNNTSSTSNMYNNNDTDNSKSRSSNRAMLRNNAHRTSLQPFRKSTNSILLPGTGSNSLNRLRESRASLKSSSTDISNINNTKNITNSPANSVSSTATPRHKSSLNTYRKHPESRNSLGSTASDSNTTASSASLSRDDYSSSSNGGKTGQGSRLSLQSVFSDVTMSNQSQSSSDDSSPSRPISFADVGDNSELMSFLNGSSFIESLKPASSTDNTVDEEEMVGPLDNDNIMSKNRDNYYDNCCVNENEDDNDNDIYNLKRDLKNMEITEEKLKFHDLKERLKTGIISEDSCLNSNNVNSVHNVDQNDYYQTLENPWEKDTHSVNSVSENIMAAPFSDDIKIASLNAKNYNSNDVSSYAYHCSANQNWSFGDSRERDDFRTLRSVLQSNNMIVKQSRSMPEVVGVVFGEGGDARTLTRGKLTTIEDEDEEEEVVRVTTL